jgi:HD-GYP domain-containing protein (c-di-GMP phosphodiesterase class II)
VGKIFLPDGILNKPGTLTAEERKITEKHPIKGAMRIMKLKGIPKIAILAAMEHHIKYDGTGYPKIKGEYTPNIVSQMIAIADTYDALRSSRVYQEAKSTEFAINTLISEKGKSFNPLLVHKFIQLIT